MGISYRKRCDFGFYFVFLRGHIYLLFGSLGYSRRFLPLRFFHQDHLLFFPYIYICFVFNRIATPALFFSFVGEWKIE